MEEKAAVHAPAIKKKINWLKVGIAVGIAAAIVLGIFWAVSLSKGGAISEGDTVKLSYTLKFSDGKVISNESEFEFGKIASSFGFASEKLDEMIGSMKVGESKTITLSASDVYGKYSDENLMPLNRTRVSKRIGYENRTFEIPSEAFLQVFGENAILNKVHENNLDYNLIWKTKVVSISDASINVSIQDSKGDKITIDNMTSLEITDVTSEKVTYKVSIVPQTIEDVSGNYTLSMTDDSIITVWTPAVGQPILYGFSTAKVLSMNDTTVVLDFNSEFADQNVTVTVKALGITEKASAASSEESPDNTEITVPLAKTDKPKVDLFVWSFCPGGVYGESVVNPVVDLLKDKIEANVVFIGPVTADKAAAASSCFAGRGKSTDDALKECCLTKEYNGKTYYSCALHNNKNNHLESAESERQACIQNLYGSVKYFAYVSEFNSKCHAMVYGKTSYDESAFNTCWKGALEKIGTVSEVESCMGSNEGLKILIADSDYADRLGIGTSPSFFVNGYQVSPSGPDSLKQNVCSAFNTAPSECSETITATTQTSSGGCGG